jgi:hypothetical protein
LAEWLRHGKSNHQKRSAEIETSAAYARHRLSPVQVHVAKLRQYGGVLKFAHRRIAEAREGDRPGMRPRYRPGVALRGAISSSPNRQFGVSNADNSPDLIATILL